MMRQDSFERLWAARHDVPAESLVQYRFESRDGYRLPDMAAHYRTYCETLDSVCIGDCGTGSSEDHREYLTAIMPIKRSTAKNIAYYLEDNPEVRWEVKAELDRIDDENYERSQKVAQ